MLYLKPANFKDIQQEYDVITHLPENENGFTNDHSNCTFEAFQNQILPAMIDASKGMNLKPGFVPDTTYFLWDDDAIVGIFRCRHYLNEWLRNHAGHIGYCVLKPYRGHGYASKGLHLLLEEIKDIVKEEEIYLSCHKDNIASLKTMLKNGGYIHHEDDGEYYVRIQKSQ